MIWRPQGRVLVCSPDQRKREHMSGLSYSLKENVVFDRKNRLCCSCFLYAKICTHKHADALGECLQALGSVWTLVLLTLRPTRLCRSANIRCKRHGLSSPHDCPEVSDAFRKRPVFSIANSLHIVCSPLLLLLTFDAQL